MKFYNRPNLKRDIIVVLIFKGLAIYAIWALFFSHPLEKQLTAQKMSVHFLTD